tara:strand:+ start:58 stop:585 length:528 start_codon:yes stop_codon:yes gene_type:complete
MSDLDDSIFITQREIEVKEKELEILTKMNELQDCIYAIQELVIDYEQWGFDINNLDTFTTNYPLKLSLDEYAPHKNKWGTNNYEPDYEVFLKNLGFQYVDTGGGCDGYQKIINNKKILITHDAQTPKSMNELIDLGIYDDENSLLFSYYDIKSFKPLRLKDLNEKLINQLLEPLK